MSREDIEKTAVRTSEEAKRRGRNGGIASGRARRQKKEIRECLKILLGSKVAKDKSGKDITGAEAMATRAFQDALKGNYKRWELVRDTVGQKPAEKVIVSDIDPDVVAEVERLVDGEGSE